MNPQDKKDIHHHAPRGVSLGINGHDPLSLIGGQVAEKEKNLLAPSAHKEVFLLTHRKAEKLSAAVYLVTSFLSDNEPMKWKMRALALSVLESISALRGGSLFEREHSIGSALRAIHDALSLIEIAAMSGMLSEMNYRVLKAEYVALRRDINEKDDVHSPEHFEIPHNFFDEQNSPETVEPTHKQSPLPDVHPQGLVSGSGTTPHVSQGQHKGQDTVRYNMSLKEGSEKYRAHISVRNLVPTRSDPRNPKQTIPSPSHKSARRDVVLNLFKKGAELSVKSVAKALHGVSEKTAQRELASLVEAGVLKRTGERRWSIYSMR